MIPRNVRANRSVAKPIDPLTTAGFSVGIGGKGGLSEGQGNKIRHSTRSYKVTYVNKGGILSRYLHGFSLPTVNDNTSHQEPWGRLKLR